MAAPLIAGNDLTLMSPVTRSILTNAAVIAVDQDPLGLQGYPVSSEGGHWVLTRPLVNGDRAVVLFNETNKPAVISTTVEKIGAVNAPQWVQLNLWDGTVTQTAGPITALVAPHGIVMVVVSGLSRWGSKPRPLNPIPSSGAAVRGQLRAPIAEDCAKALWGRIGHEGESQAVAS
jgi:alpha-galactosidase